VGVAVCSKDTNSAAVRGRAGGWYNPENRSKE